MPLRAIIPLGLPRDFTPTNSSGFGSNWCGQAFIIAGKVDLTATANLK